jgi:putative transposase
MRYLGSSTACRARFSGNLLYNAAESLEMKSIGKPFRSVRLRGYDYTIGGAYFITICTHNRQPLFGKITDGKMHLNDIGQVAVDEWLKTASLRTNVILDEFIVMPNHFHGVVILKSDCNGTARRATTETFGKPVANSTPTIVRSYKSAVTKRVNALRHMPGASVWQHNYYEHVIRDENDLNSIREYIRYNPLKWAEDEENPARCGV